MSKHKGQNGVLYLAAGSQQYHGALWYAIMAAEPLVDLIYVDTDTSNASLVRSLKQLHPGIILVPARQRGRYLAKSNAALLGPGLGRTTLAQQLVSRIMRHSQRPAKVVLDADALHFLKPSWLTSQMILTPHPGEYRHLFGSLSPQVASRQVPSVLLVKRPQPAICQNGNCEYNTSAIVPLTKGGIGDVLAGVTAGLVCTHTPLRSAQLASVLVAKAAQTVWKRTGRFTTTSQLITQLPITYHLSHLPDLRP